MAVVNPTDLARRLGESFPVIDLSRRGLLKCTARGSKSATIRLSDPHAPFTPGWQSRAGAG